MEENNQNKDNFWIDEPLSPPDANSSQGDAKDLSPTKKQNIKNAFGSGAGLKILILLSIIIIIFIAFIVRALSSSDREPIHSDSQIDIPETPNKDITGIPVTPAEAKRRQQIANQEALAAAANGTSYQPGFDINTATENQQIDPGSFNIEDTTKFNQTTQSASQTNSNIQLTLEQQAQLKKIEDERKIQEEIRKRQLDEWQKQYDARNAYVDQQKALILADIGKILNGNSQRGFSSTVSYLPNTPKNEHPTQTTSPNEHNLTDIPKQAVFKTGNTIFAVLDSELNTDASNIVIATVYGGPYNGSKLLGQVQRGSGNIELRFNRLAPQNGGKTLNIDAIAMRMSDASTGVATSVNKHTISRYASLIFSNSLAGLGQAAQQQDSTVTQLSNGSTVTSSTAATDKQIIGYVAGSVGSAMANEIGQGFNRQPTYKIARGTSVAVFFLQDVYSD